MHALKGKSVVVTGGAGFVGSHIAEELVKIGASVVVFDKVLPKDARNLGSFMDSISYVQGDVCDKSAVVSVCTGVDVVFHEAALPSVPYSITHPEETHRINVDGTLSVLEAAREQRVRRVVFASSGAVYGDRETMPIGEDMPAAPKSPYGLHKYIGERYCKLWSELYDTETVSLRYFNVYGPRLDPEGEYALAVGAFLLAKKEGRPITIYGDGTVTRDYTHVRDVACANLLAAESAQVGNGEVINIGSGRNVTIQFLAELINGGKERIVYGSARVEAHDSQADNRKAKELLGWEPRERLEEGIQELKAEFGLSPFA